MNFFRQIVADEEPIGIVISRGSRAEVAPRVSAYVWGGMSELDEPPTTGIKAA